MKFESYPGMFQKPPWERGHPALDESRNALAPNRPPWIARRMPCPLLAGVSEAGMPKKAPGMDSCVSRQEGARHAPHFNRIKSIVREAVQQ